MASDIDQSQVIALSLLAAGEAFHCFSSFLPSWFTVKALAVGDNDLQTVQLNINRLRSGYQPSVMIGLSLGAVISWIAKSPLPLVFATGASAAMISQYERAIPAQYSLSPDQLIQVLLSPDGSGNTAPSQVQATYGQQAQLPVVSTPRKVLPWAGN